VKPGDPTNVYSLRDGAAIGSRNATTKRVELR
jgi:hypothetical protein